MIAMSNNGTQRALTNYLLGGTQFGAVDSLFEQFV